MFASVATPSALPSATLMPEGFVFLQEIANSIIRSVMPDRRPDWWKMETEMKPTKYVLAGALTLLLTGAGYQPAAAETGVEKTRFNFGSTFSASSRSYRGKQIVKYKTVERPGTVIIDTSAKRLYYVLKDNKAISYGVGVGRAGFEWSGTAHIARRAEWPAWRPPAEMIERELRENGRQLPEVMEGGPSNPLGARALYLYQGSQDTLYRIHGTNYPASIGRAMSSGCIRMLNSEVIDLYDRIKIGTKVIVI